LMPKIRIALNPTGASLTDMMDKNAAIILPHHGCLPQLASQVWLAPGSTVIGEVSIGRGSSIWFQSVVRGDVFPITIGERTNIQDLTMIHVTGGKFATTVGDDVTVGHRVILHGCRIGSRCLVGMGAIVMDDVTVGDNCIIGAGALLPPGKKYPSGVLIKGSPAKVARELTPEELEWLPKSAAKYTALAATYADGQFT
jgi:carbonic anhydrase/acetyltransferase-like protein (isoleucine patch superfamily)